MGKPAARVGDMHMCPMATPGTPPIPHVGGPLLPPGVPNVLIGGMPAAVMGGMATCVGPPDSVVLGSTGVFFSGMPAARMGDTCAHGGVIAVGMPTVLIGEMMPGQPAAAVAGPAVVAGGGPGTSQGAGESASVQVAVMTAAAKRGAPFCEMCGESKEKTSAATQSAKSAKKDFVEIELKDAEGNPVAGEPYKIELPNGTVKEGVTGLDGKARVDGVDPGSCKVSFPRFGGKG